MSVAYTSTSFGAHASSSPYQHNSGSGRHQRQYSASSGSSGTIGGVSYAESNAAILPPPATAPSPTRSSHVNSERMMRAQYDQIGAFFGARSNSSDDRRSGDRASTNTGSTARGAIPPSYDGHTEVESLPTYSKSEEYNTEFNRKLFIYGFLFFPLWIVGILAPFVKPASDPTRDNRSKEDQEADWTNMRKAEMRWAKRCAFALLGFIILVITAVVVGVVVANNK